MIDPNRASITFARAQRRRTLAYAHVLNRQCRVEWVFLTVVGDNHG